jgi:hypothetical protein
MIDHFIVLTTISDAAEIRKQFGPLSWIIADVSEFLFDLGAFAINFVIRCLAFVFMSAYFDISLNKRIKDR